MDAFPVLAYSFSNKENDLKKVTKVLNEQLIPKLQTVDGVQNAQLNGQTNREITLKFKQNELEKYGLTADDVENYLKRQQEQRHLDCSNLVIKINQLLLMVNINLLMLLKHKYSINFGRRTRGNLNPKVTINKIQPCQMLTRHHRNKIQKRQHQII